MWGGYMKVHKIWGGAGWPYIYNRYTKIWKGTRRNTKVWGSMNIYLVLSLTSWITPWLFTELYTWEFMEFIEVQVNNKTQLNWFVLIRKLNRANNFNIGCTYSNNNTIQRRSKLLENMHIWKFRTKRKRK